jgi:hypothetical protein
MQPAPSGDSKFFRNLHTIVIFSSLVLIAAVLVLGEFLSNAKIISNRAEDFTQYFSALAIVFVLFYVIRV